MIQDLRIDNPGAVSFKDTDCRTHDASLALWIIGKAWHSGCDLEDLADGFGGGLGTMGGDWSGIRDSSAEAEAKMLARSMDHLSQALRLVHAAGRRGVDLVHLEAMLEEPEPFPKPAEEGDMVEISAWDTGGMVVGIRQPNIGSEAAVELLIETCPDDPAPHWYRVEPTEYEIVDGLPRLTGLEDLYWRPTAREDWQVLECALAPSIAAATGRQQVVSSGGEYKTESIETEEF